MITDGVVVGRVPGIHNGGVHQPDISVWLLPQGDDVLLGGPGLHFHHLCEVGTINIGVPAQNIYQQQPIAQRRTLRHERDTRKRYG